jgi:hypothetical protein
VVARRKEEAMNDGPEWFAPKRYGYGASPISWQGWALTLGFAAIAILLSVKFAGRPVKLFAVLAPFLIAFTVICARTTRGGWRWRWGDED